MSKWATCAGKSAGYRVIGTYLYREGVIVEEFTAVPVSWLRVLKGRVVLCMWPPGKAGTVAKTIAEAPAPQSDWDVYCVFQVTSGNRVFATLKEADKVCLKYCLDTHSRYSSCAEDGPEDDDITVLATLPGSSQRPGVGTRRGGRAPAEGSYQASIIPSDVGLNDSDAPTAKAKAKPVCFTFLYN